MKIGNAACGSIVVPTSYTTTGVLYDLVIFVTGTPGTTTGTICNPSPAPGMTRPTTGWLQISNSMSIASGEYQTNFYTILQQMLFILGFSRSIWPANWIVATTARGITATGVSTPLVLQRAQAHFNCYSITNVELENQIGASPNYWERRMMGSDIMTVNIEPNTFVSDITLALLESTGWYTANYSKADPMAWGWMKGCEFLSSNCINSNMEPISNEFCSRLNGEGCSIDNNFKAICSVTRSVTTTFGAPLNDYYNNKTLAKDIYADNCPYMNPEVGLDCRNQEDNPFGVLVEELFGPQSKCFTGTLTKANYATFFNNNFNKGMCFQYQCIPQLGGFELVVQIGEVYINCEGEPSQVKVPGYEGYLNCPDPNEFCPTSLCSLTCSGNGICLSGKCICNNGYYGEDCDQAICLDGCNGNGQCDLDMTCSCYDGWSGTNCSVKSLVSISSFAIKKQVLNCSRCDGLLDCFGNSCECYPFAGRNCVQ